MLMNHSYTLPVRGKQKKIGACKKKGEKDMTFQASCQRNKGGKLRR